MLVWTCEICMKYVLLLSSPSSQTQLLLAFISMLVLNTYVFIMRVVMRVVMMCLLHQGRRPRRWKLVPHAPKVGLDTLHVLGRVVFAYVIDVHTCRCDCVLCDWLQIMNLVLVHLLMKMIYVQACSWKIKY